MVISPDPVEVHTRYAQQHFGDGLPYLYVADSSEEIARRYGMLRKEEHPHGGYWHRSLWVLDPNTIIRHKILPWRVTMLVAEYQRLFTLLSSEPGEWVALCLPDRHEGECQ